MLFNKSGNPDLALEEVRKYAGFIYKSSEFGNIELDIQLAEEDIIKIIGQQIYDRAQTHYDSNEYELPNPNATQKLNDNLVHHIQLPTALYAALAWSMSNDVSHTSEGRRVSIDSDKEKMAWEWMIDADNRNIIHKAHKTSDRLIKFLEDNEDDLAEWKNSDAQKEARSLFINNAVDFDKGFPIDESRRFYIHITPFIIDVENREIKPVLGVEKFDEIKSEIVSNNLSADNTIILNDYIKPALRMLSMAKAIKLLAVQVLPDGVYQNYISDRLSLKTRKPADTDVRREVSVFMSDEGSAILTKLKEHIRLLQTIVDGETYENTAIAPRDYSSKKHFRV